MRVRGKHEYDKVPEINSGDKLTGHHETAGIPGANDDNTQGYFPGYTWTDTGTGKLWKCLDAATGAAQWTVTEDSIASLQNQLNSFVKETFTPSAAQTVFTLADTSVEKRIILTVNGQEQLQGTDYTVAGTTLTWLNADYQLGTTDRLTIYYNK